MPKNGKIDRRIVDERLNRQQETNIDKDKRCRRCMMFLLSKSILRFHFMHPPPSINITYQTFRRVRDDVELVVPKWTIRLVVSSACYR